MNGAMDMRQLKLTFLFTVLMSMVEVSLFAKEDTTFEVNGIYYYCYDYNNNVMVVNNCQGVPYGEFVNNYQGDIVIPEKIVYKGETYNVTKIGGEAFFRAYYVSSVKIPNSVTDIENGAFAESGLTSVTIPANVTIIGNDAFNDCHDLTTITMNCQIPPLIQDDTFNNYSVTLYVPFACKNAYLLANYWKNFNEIIEIAPSSKGIEFADTNVKELCVANWDTDGDGELSEIEAAAVTDLSTVFRGNKSIQTFTELKYFISLKSIKPSAFSGCTNLVTIVIPYSVTSIEENAFYNCSSLIRADIPNSVTYIGHFAFYGTGLTNVTIPVTDLAAFCNNNLCNEIGKPIQLIDNEGNEIKEYVIPDGVTNIGNNAFYACKGLTSVTLPESVTTIGNNAFCACDGLTNVSISNSVTNMGEAVFKWCHGLTNVTIGNSLARIQEEAFYDCTGLANVIIGKGVTKIDDFAFFYCENMTEVYCYADIVPSTATYTFGQSNIKNATLHVPFGCKAAYEAANHWKEFKEIIEMEKCATPTISLVGGKLHFECETEGVQLHYEFTTPDSEEGIGNNIAVTPVYIIKVYASKEGYTDSDVATSNVNVAGMKGDADGDGVVDIADAVHIVNFIVGKINSLAPRFDSNQTNPE